MARPKKELSIFNLSFLDALCCALGAVIVLLVISFMHKKEAEAAARARQLAEARLEAARREKEQVDEAARRVEEALAEVRKRGAAASAEAKELEKEIEKLRSMDFLGLKTDKKNVVLLVDLSGSMEAHREILRRAVTHFIDLLRFDEVKFRFNMLTFGGAGTRSGFPHWRGGHRLVDATPQNKSDARQWVAESITQMGGGTPTVDAFHEAFQYPEAEVLILFTDGAPDGAIDSDGEIIPAAIDSALAGIRADKARYKPGGVEIKCVGIGPSLYHGDGLFRQFLIDLCDPQGNPPGRGSFLGL